MKTLILTTMTFLFLGFQAQAEELKCFNDLENKRGYTNTALMTALANAKDPLSIAFKSNQISALENGKSSNETCLLCKLRGSSETKNPMKSIQKMAGKLSSPQIKKECIVSSLQREVRNAGYLCDSKDDITQKFKNGDKNTPCMDEKVVDFVHYAINQAIDCMSPPGDAIDPRFILKKINNETAFNFFMAYPGGVGLGQLTSPPVKDIAGWYTDKKKATFNQGNAYHILESLMASNKASCAPFKKIIGAEMEFPPPVPGKEENYCKWLSVGEGVGRNLIYSLGYFVYSRDNTIKPAIARSAPALAKNKDLVNSLTLVAYGPGGPAQAKSIISGLRLTNKSDPTVMQKKIAAKSAYLDQTHEKMGELLDIQLGTDNEKGKNTKRYTEKDLKGDSCITK